MSGSTPLLSSLTTLCVEHSFPISPSQHVIKVYFRLVCTSARGVRPAVNFHRAIKLEAKHQKNSIYLDLIEFDISENNILVIALLACQICESLVF